MGEEEGERKGEGEKAGAGAGGEREREGRKEGVDSKIRTMYKSPLKANWLH